MKRSWFVLMVTAVLVMLSGEGRGAADTPAATSVAPYRLDFESLDTLPEGWTSEGDVSVDARGGFKGQRSLRLQRTAADVGKPCSATGASFAVQPGIWQLEMASKSALVSPDNSFKAVVVLEYLGADGKTMDALQLVNTFGQGNWQPIRRQIEIPEGARGARLRVHLDKASGSFWVDELAMSFVSAVPKKDRRIDRIMFETAQLGNLLLPEDKRTVSLTLLATAPMNEKELTLTWAVRDYWGAELAAPAKVTLAEKGKQADGKLVYTGSIDLAGLPLDVGRYYEVHAEAPRANDEPFRNYTSVAILPKAAAKNYRAEQIPFTNRNWSNDPPEFTLLGDRLGIRMASSGDFALRQKLDMGAMFSVGTHAIEGRSPGWEKITPDVLRENVRKNIEKYKSLRPLMVSLGNEPPVMKERLADNVAAYKVVYEEVKKIDPSIIVVSTSVGASEPFFEAGFQNYCDAVDFHSYEDWQNIREQFREYERLFAKYGGKKPVWSTEIGLNSHGLARQAVATTMIKKLTSFFASGGGNVCWFDLGWPDPDARIPDDQSSAHNVFDCRYAPRYCPKLDAIAYYNIINGLCVKKPAGEKVYGADTYAFLFRDSEDNCLLVLWKEKGRQDVMLPLAGVGQVMAIDIDGRRSDLDAGGKGLTLTVNEDPLLLLYHAAGNDDPARPGLPEKLGAPQVQLATVPEGIIKGGAAAFDVAVAGDVSPARVEVVTPAFWNVRKTAAAKTPAGAQRVKVSVTAPDVTSAREGNLAVRLKDENGKLCGELRTRVNVAGVVAVRVVPEPVGGASKPAGVRLVIQNNSAQKQEVAWKLAVTGEMVMDNGFYKPLTTATSAYFSEAAEGTRSLEGRAAAEVVVPLAGLDMASVYRVKASVTEPSGRIITSERFVSGFLGVPRAKGPIKLDASLLEPDWKTAPVAQLNERRQVHQALPRAVWKGTSDLSGTMQCLWDEKYLYLAVKVTDDIFVNEKVDGEIWYGDGLQLLVDPCRDRPTKAGKYDIAVAMTRKGPQAWCYLSADAAAPSGEVKDIVISTRRGENGNMTYLLGIPWSRVAPFKPAVGANLGWCTVINEDDGPGRASHIGWFGEIEFKNTDCLGDLILQP